MVVNDAFYSEALDETVAVLCSKGASPEAAIGHLSGNAALYNGGSGRASILRQQAALHGLTHSLAAKIPDTASVL